MKAKDSADKLGKIVTEQMEQETSVLQLWRLIYHREDANRQSYRSILTHSVKAVSKGG